MATKTQIYKEVLREYDALRKSRSAHRSRIVSSIIRRANGILRSWRDWNGNREKNGKNR